MTPAARIAQTIELLETIHADEDSPADAIAVRFSRARRYMGAKDRQAVIDGAWRVLRRHARLFWHLDALGAPADARALVLADLVVGEGMTPDQLKGLFDGSRYGPARLSGAEQALVARLAGRVLDDPDMAEGIAAEVPGWAYEPLKALFEDDFLPEMLAFTLPAPLDLRVNRLKTSREAALAALHAAGLADAAPTALSPDGIRLPRRVQLNGMELFRSGGIEIQDEGSQLLAALVGARPGERVCDFCAGAGGKSLALAAAMDNRGELVACDVAGHRLDGARRRLRKAGIQNTRVNPLRSERDDWVSRNAGRFDAVLVDAPCTGVGTWRRNPDQRWRRLGPDLEELTGLQASILGSAARLVRPGGRLVYGTCSLLPMENEAQIERFLDAEPDFSLVPVDQAMGMEEIADGPFLRLTPARHGTDGFFAALLERGGHA